MAVFLLLVQVLGPVLLMAALVTRSRSRTLKLLQAAAVFFYLLAVHLAGLWLELPWWTPWLLWTIYLIALPRGWRSTPHIRRVQREDWSVFALWAVAAGGAAWLTTVALLAQRPPPGPVVEVALPLPAGRYVVVNGGSRSLTNAHLETLHPSTPRQAASRGQSYAVDLVGLTPMGRMSEGWRPRDPARYAVFGTPVIAPCNGRVIQRLDGSPDMPVPVADKRVMAGNHVVLRCGRVQLLLAHLRLGSVAVKQNEAVHTGQKLGQVGNSGNSGAPHLHIHAQRLGSPEALFAAAPLPIRIDGRYLVRGDRL